MSNNGTFRSSDSGNILVTTAIAIAVLSGLIALALDVSNLFNQRSEVQNALDTAVLAAASSTATDATTLQTITTTAFNANLPDVVKSTAQISTFDYNTTSKKITATATGTYTTYFGGIAGLSTVSYSAASSGLKSAKGTVEVALVLDNTYSMSVALDTAGTKMQVLQTAATNLVNTLMTTQNAGFVKVAVVPYADYVNVGTTTTGNWLSVAANYSTTSAGTPATAAKPAGPVVCNTVSTKSVCSGGSMQPYVVSIIDGVVTMGTHLVGQTCTTVPITPVTTCSQTPAQPAKPAVPGTTTWYKWYGCVNHLVGTNGLLAPPESASQAKPYVGYLTTSQQCLNPILPLTTQSAPVLASINNLVYQIGSYKPATYIAGGITWGVNVLSPTATFASGAPYDTANKMPRKVIILMTDGYNTNSLNANGSLTAATFNNDGTISAASQPGVTKANTAEVAACSYAKSQNIEIYAIGFGISDPTSLSNLQQCATDASHYFDAKNSASLISAFQIIAGNLQNVRIAS
jgi:Flp pilus assembly protein TadG